MADLITEAELLESIPSLSTRSDLARLISAASAAVEKYCGREFTEATVTEIHDGKGLPRLWLRRFPVSDIDSITVNDETLAADDYTPNLTTGELVRGDGQSNQRFQARFPKGTQNVTVVYTGGYATIPDDLKHATIICVRHLVEALNATGLYSSEGIGDYSYTFNTAFQPGIPKAAEILLGAYVVIF